MDDEQGLQDLDKELDEMVPRHIIIDPNGYSLHGYDKAEAAGVLEVLADHLKEQALESWREAEENEEE